MSNHLDPDLLKSWELDLILQSKSVDPNIIKIVYEVTKALEDELSRVKTPSLWRVEESCCDGHFIACVATEAEAKEIYDWYVREGRSTYTYYEVVPTYWEPPYRDWSPAEEVEALSQKIGDLISLTEQDSNNE